MLLLFLLVTSVAASATAAVGTLGLKSGGRLGTAYGGLGVLGAAPGGGGGGGASHNPPASPLFAIETFEGAGYSTAGWSEVPSGGTVDEDYTGVVLDGSQSLRIVTAGSITYASRNLTAIGHLWVYVQFRAVTITTGEKSVLEVQDVGSTMLGKVTLSTGGFKVYSGSSPITLLGSVSAGTKYGLWFEYNKNDGMNRVANLGFSTDGTRPTSGNNYGQATGPTSAVDTQILAIGVAGSDFGADAEFIYDYIVADDAQIGDNP
jgi:hypothetical protein